MEENGSIWTHTYPLGGLSKDSFVILGVFFFSLIMMDWHCDQRDYPSKPSTCSLAINGGRRSLCTEQPLQLVASSSLPLALGAVRKESPPATVLRARPDQMCSIARKGVASS